MKSLPEKFIHTNDEELTEWGYRTVLTNQIKGFMKVALSDKKPLSTEKLEELHLFLQALLND